MLVAFDMEGCLTCDPTVWEIMHRRWGTWDSHGAPYWQRYREGGMPYDEFARMDVAAWRGAPQEMLRAAAEDVQLMPGCRTLVDALARHGVEMVLISNGLMCVAQRFVGRHRFREVFANAVVCDGGRLTGELQLRVPYRSKGDILRRCMARTGRDASDVVAVGDDVADIPMFELAGVSVAIAPGDERVRRAATFVLEDRNLEGCADIVLSRLPSVNFRSMQQPGLE